MRGRLNADLIAETALDLIDEKGDFSIPEVSRRLHVSGAALYRHVTNREEIIALVRQRVAPDRFERYADQDWERALLAWIDDYRGVFVTHPNLVNVLVRQTMKDPSSTSFFNELAKILIRGGVASDRVMVWLTAFDSFTISIALFAIAPADIWAPDAEQQPEIAAAIGSIRRDPPFVDQVFSTGITAMLSELRNERDGRPSRGRGSQRG